VVEIEVIRDCRFRVRVAFVFLHVQALVHALVDGIRSAVTRRRRRRRVFFFAEHRAPPPARATMLERDAIVALRTKKNAPVLTTRVVVAARKPKRHRQSNRQQKDFHREPFGSMRLPKPFSMVPSTPHLRFFFGGGRHRVCERERERDCCLLDDGRLSFLSFCAAAACVVGKKFEES